MKLDSSINLEKKYLLGVLCVLGGESNKKQAGH
jgi:hypothetical protein